jgi:hypothetical protein
MPTIDNTTQTKNVINQHSAEQTPNTPIVGLGRKFAQKHILGFDRV